MRCYMTLQLEHGVFSVRQEIMGSIFSSQYLDSILAPFFKQNVGNLAMENGLFQ